MNPFSKPSNIIAIEWFIRCYGLIPYHEQMGLMLCILGMANICAGSFFIIPSIVYHISPWILVLCVAFATYVTGSWCMWYMEWMCDKHLYFMTSLLGNILYGLMAYFIGVYMFSSMSCVYSGQITGNRRWYACLRKAFNSPYYSNNNGINVDPLDWRVYIILVSWLFY